MLLNFLGIQKNIADVDNEAQWQKKIRGAVDLRLKLGLLYANADARLERPIFRFEDFLYTIMVHMLYPLFGIFDVAKHIREFIKNGKREFKDGETSENDSATSGKLLICSSFIYLLLYLEKSLVWSVCIISCFVPIFSRFS